MDDSKSCLGFALDGSEVSESKAENAFASLAAEEPDLDAVEATGMPEAPGMRELEAANGLFKGLTGIPEAASRVC